MNEQIKLLVKQSTVIVNNPYCNSDGKPVVDNFEEHFSIGKFAELIVAECAGIYDAIDNGNLHMGTDNYLGALSKHFGDKK